MKKQSLVLSLSCLAILIVSQPRLSAMYARYAPAELIDRSELIVEGTYVGETTMDFSWSQKVRVGVIQVTKTLKGKTERERVYLEIKDASAPISSEEIVYKPGQTGLWLLVQSDASRTELFNANHPQRFVPRSEAKAISELISLLEASEG